MIYIGDKELDAVYVGKKIITQVYKGATLIWEAIKSCFGAGYWKNDAPWVNTEGWRNK